MTNANQPPTWATTGQHSGTVTEQPQPPHPPAAPSARDAIILPGGRQSMAPAPVPKAAVTTYLGWLIMISLGQLVLLMLIAYVALTAPIYPQ